jgi:mono/diheme cytochrome c family protein
MSLRLRLLTGLALLALMVIPVLPRVGADPETKTEPPAAKVDFVKQILPVLNSHCLGCHNAKKPKGGVTFDNYPNEKAALKDRAVWEKVAQMVRSREMPPEGRAKPTQQEIELVTGWIDTQLAALDCGRERDPGRVTLRRLNRAEYNNTVRDLLGITFKPADDFPSDDVGYGFDNIGDVLSLPPLLLEKYLAAAEKISEEVFKNAELRKRIVIAEPDGKNNEECAGKIVEAFATRAYRRPTNREEVRRLVGLVRLAESNGDSFDKGVQLAMQAVLASPHFLFRVESDQPNRADGNHTLSDLELASRLSYFLWSTMPDEELFNLARQNKLRQDNNLETQVRRMLKDPKSHALVENFAGQWLQLRNLKGAMPDPGRFRGFNEELRSAMARETEMFVESIIQEDHSILEFIDADFTFLNERLAKHYGIEGVQGKEFQKVELKEGQRGGILTQASVLTVTSNPTRTSPVKRGKWILENILGTPPPPPPPDVPELNEDKKVADSLPLRQRMEQHRKNANCASCHARMDPLGFGLENFDAVGAWRTKDGKFDVDASGTLPDGQKFEGSAGLKAILKKKDGLFRHCLSEKLMTYALGRGLEYYDRCAVDRVADLTATNDNKFSGLVLAIVQSEPFQLRRVIKRGDK